MKKSHILLLVVGVAVFALFLQILFGPYLSAKLSTLPVIQRLKLLRPQAPIVINTREEVRVSDSEDVVNAFNRVKSRLAAVLLITEGQTTLIGSAVSISGDGVLVTSKQAVGEASLENIVVRLSDGRTARVLSAAPDPASNLLFLKVDASGLASASFGDSASLLPGTRVVLAAGLDAKDPYFLGSFIASGEQVAGSASTDFASRTFGLQTAAGLIPGQAVVHLGGDIIGLWDGSNVISATTIKPAIGSYFSNAGVVKRSGFGLRYRFVSSAESAVTNVPLGAQVVAVEENSAGRQAGLRPGDVITRVGEASISESVHLEQYLERLQPGSSATVTLNRGTATLTLTISAQEL